VPKRDGVFRCVHGPTRGLTVRIADLKLVLSARGVFDFRRFMKMQVVEIYTDGSCFANGTPGGSPGGYGIVLLPRDGKEKTISGRIPSTTSPRAELTATDSQCVSRGYNECLKGWQAKQFHGVRNVDLWKALTAVTESHDVEITWVKRNYNKWAALADRLARGAMKISRNKAMASVKLGKAV
jgi:ribonuclease HI